MYRKVLFAASLMLASTAQAQTPVRALLNNAVADFRIVGTPSGPVDEAPDFRLTGDRALLGQVENRPSPTTPASFTHTPIDGSRALMGKWPSASPVSDGGTERQSSFRAEVRGDVISTALGQAEFGAVQNPDHSPGAFVVSLGTCSPQGAILFTRRSGAPLDVGRYRISAGADGENEIMALVITGRPTNPTGAFHGQSGWLVVTEASEGFIAGRFQLDAPGFVAAEPQRENRHVNVIGSFTATTASSSFRICKEAA